MKLNWGTNIAVLYISFVVISGGMAIYMMSIDVELVTDNYYEKELVYQDQIESIRRAEALPEQVTYVDEDEYIKIKFPKIFPHNEIKGEIHLYRPSDEKMDIVFPIELDSNRTVLIPKNELQMGYWKAKIDWRVKSVNYFNEYRIYLQ